MSDQGALFLAPTDEALRWWEHQLGCEGCRRVTYRLPESDEPCLWCGGALAEVVRA